MVLADTVAIALSILGVMLSLNAVWLLCRGIWGGAVERASTVSRRGLIASFFIGLIITAVAVFLVIALAKTKNGLAGVIAIGLASLYFFFASVGVSGLAAVIGERLCRFHEGAPWRSTAAGGGVLVFSYLIPFAGWFVLLPVSYMIGAGAAARSLLIRPEQVAPSDAAAGGDRLEGTETVARS